MAIGGDAAADAAADSGPDATPDAAPDAAATPDAAPIVCAPVDDLVDDRDGDCDGQIDEGLPYRAEQVQALFDRQCLGCHVGPGASSDLRLAGDFRDQTVGVLSLQSLQPLIAPGDHEASYLWHKLAGTAARLNGGGDRMPVGGPYWDAYMLDRLARFIDALPR
ncbi:MAG: hypothetical protein H6704_12030 [Myxococcales bacterium]|nr:hypothetical protein [Myxococcales bacterium]